MYAIILFGVIMIAISLVMIADPARWSRSIVQFCHWRYFHEFEVISRICIGMIFLAYAYQTSAPHVMAFIGYLVLAVGIGLSFMPVNWHKRFGLWSAAKFLSVFRPAGIVSLTLGVFLIYAAMKGPEAL